MEDVIVTARRSGAPIWRIATPTGEVIVVGSAPAIQAEVRWRPTALAAAVARSDRIIMAQTATMSLGDYLRLRRNRARLPDGLSLTDVIDADTRARLAVLEERLRRNYEHRGLTYVAQDLLNRLDYDNDVGTSVAGVVERAAREAGRNVVLVGDLDARGADDGVRPPDAAQLRCLYAAISAVEAGAAGIAQRSAAWASAAIQTLLGSPLQQALDRCAFFADETLQQQARAQWRDALATALSGDGITMIVASASIVAEPAGLLDQATAAGFVVAGPER